MKLRLTKLGGLIFVIILLLFNGCKIVTVEQASTASTGEKITVHLECQIVYDDTNPHYGLLGLLIPNDWATDSVYYEGDVGTGSLTFLHPDSADAEPGIQDYWADSLEIYFPSGDNMHWVVYQSDNPYTVSANDYIDVYIDLTVGTTPGNYNISYFISNAANEIKLGLEYYDISQDNPINVVGPELVNVTLIVNTSTNLDTLGENGFVEVRGALHYNWATGAILPGGKVISWDTSSDLDMTNIGGDYWTVTFQMYSGDTLKYKFWTGHTSETGTYPEGGWEGPFVETIPGVNTRVLVPSQNDTIVPVQYYNPDLKTGSQDQYWKPFEPKEDSVAVYFRVNIGGEMEAERFDPTVHGPIGMRGDGGASGGTLDWDITKVNLKWEEKSIYNGSFWSGVAYFDKDSVTEGTTQAFKFFAENTPDFSWEDGGDHTFTYPVALKDTTIHWTWFSGKKISGVLPIESIITWRMSTEALEALGLFNRGVGDKIEIRGPRGWDAEDAVELFYQPLLQEWTSANESFKLPPGTEIFYKYFIAWDSTRFDETSPNYIDGLINTDGSTRGWEEPAITGGGNRTHVFQNATEQTAIGDFGFERQFFNSVPANGVFNNDMTVTWNVDMRNATNPDSNAANASNLFRPGTDSVFVVWDGELLAVTQGQDMWGGTRFVELTDPDGDLIYSGSYTITVSAKFPHGWYQLGYKIAYSTSEPGIYIVNTGGGVERGRRYMQYIHPDHIHEGSPWPQTVWPTTFNLPTVPWRDTNLFVEYPPPDLTEATGVSNKETGLALDFVLEPNYPNPFNPSTTINYTMAKGKRVSIKIYNVSGQLVATLIDSYQPQGHHFVKWFGKDTSGKEVTSGMYLVKMVAGDFNQVNKIMLLR